MKNEKKKKKKKGFHETKLKIYICKIWNSVYIKYIKYKRLIVIL